MPIVPQPIDIARPSAAKRIIAAGVNSAVWIFGVLVLRWDRYDVHVFLLVDLMLFVSFSALKVIVSLDGDASFFSDLFPRLYFAAMLFAFGGFLAYHATTSSLPDDFHVGAFLAASPARWSYGVVFVNYSGYLFHDFLWSGAYKKANPYVEAIVDFLSVVFTVVIVSVFLVLADPERRSDAFYRMFAVGFVLARFGWEVFVALRGRTFLANAEPEI